MALRPPASRGATQRFPEALSRPRASASSGSPHSRSCPESASSAPSSAGWRPSSTNVRPPASTSALYAAIPRIA